MKEINKIFGNNNTPFDEVVSYCYFIVLQTYLMCLLTKHGKNNQNTYKGQNDCLFPLLFSYFPYRC